MVLKSYAKLNLYLKVHRKRKDGFHEVTTLFERISLFDTVILTPRPDNRITISCCSPEVPSDHTNLCYKAARLLQEKCKVKKGVNIQITKRVPVSAGLGGGSSNAATTLAGLNKLWKLKLTVKQLASLASFVGSDVAFFVYNTPWARAGSRGEKIAPLGTLKNKRLWHLLVVPRIHVSTPLIYKGWDKLSGKRKARLTSAKANVTITISALKAGDFPISGFLFNNLEPVTIKLYPEVGVIKDKLLSSGAQMVLMSGSGPAVFGIVASRQQAERIRLRLKREGRSWRSFVVRTV